MRSSLFYVIVALFATSQAVIAVQNAPTVKKLSLMVIVRSRQPGNMSSLCPVECIAF
ncbi:hypothetical protein K443DRAFT_13921 [Laccaria amethystina LaAM-08-1]|uniref:Uncharacterized protein n=1 Tax=Laccaria amethystina LaAM-08-1 TaxID=1095629 RepID=A0A0C9WNL5_9AGAR|nr:hypothetical protein K443DRAFT_13921 [Laccaria amethystina LaAM-08-1]